MENDGLKPPFQKSQFAGFLLQELDTHSLKEKNKKKGLIMYDVYWLKNHKAAWAILNKSRGS